MVEFDNLKHSDLPVWKSNRKTGDPVCKTGSKRSYGKVEELQWCKQARRRRREEKKNCIDIEPKDEITFDDFTKMQFQVGEIIACEEVKKSKKLLCSQVKIGSQVKQIVSGIKAHYRPEEMVGKKVMVLVNLKPAKLAGVLSEGMLLCAEDEKGELALMAPDKEDASRCRNLLITINIRKAVVLITTNTTAYFHSYCNALIFTKEGVLMRITIN